MQSHKMFIQFQYIINVINAFTGSFSCSGVTTHFYSSILIERALGENMTYRICSTFYVFILTEFIYFYSLQPLHKTTR